MSSQTLESLPKWRKYMSQTRRCVRSQLPYQTCAIQSNSRHGGPVSACIKRERLQVEAWTPQLNKVTEFFAQLQAVDLTDVPPTLRVTDEVAEATPRADVVEKHPMSEDFLDSVPAREGNLLKVPAIQGEQ